MSLSGTNGNTPTPNDLMAHAVDRVRRESSNSSVTAAELAIALADAQAHLHRANQHEVENLFRVLDSKSFNFNAENRKKAADKLVSILGIG